MYLTLMIPRRVENTLHEKQLGKLQERDLVDRNANICCDPKLNSAASVNRDEKIEQEKRWH